MMRCRFGILTRVNLSVPMANINGFGSCSNSVASHVNCKASCRLEGINA